MDASKPILCDSPRPAVSNAHCPNAVRPLVQGLLIHVYFSSPGKYWQTLGHWVLQACGHFETYTIQFPSGSWLEWGPSRLWRTSARWGNSRFLPADLYSHPDASKPTRFDSPQPPDSNAPCPDSVRPLVEGLSILLYFGSPGKYFLIVGYWGLQACGHFETYTIQFPSPSGFQRTLSRRYPTTGWRVSHSFVL